MLQHEGNLTYSQEFVNCFDFNAPGLCSTMNEKTREQFTLTYMFHLCTLCTPIFPVILLSICIFLVSFLLLSLSYTDNILICRQAIADETFSSGQLTVRVR